MIKKSVTFTNADGNTVTEDFYFHLRKVDLIELEAKYEKEGGVQKYFERVMGEGNAMKTLNVVREFILASYGQRTPNGGFVKTPSMVEEFAGTDAFSELFMELGMNADKASAFISGIVPGDLRAQLDQVLAGQSGEQRPPNRAERRHPSDTAAKEPPPGPRPEAAAPSLEERIHAAEPAQPPVQQPRVLSRDELIEMDDAELRSGLAEGRYKLQ